MSVAKSNRFQFFSLPLFDYQESYLWYNFDPKSLTTEINLNDHLFIIIKKNKINFGRFDLLSPDEESADIEWLCQKKQLIKFDKTNLNRLTFKLKKFAPAFVVNYFHHPITPSDEQFYQKSFPIPHLGRELNIDLYKLDAVKAVGNNYLYLVIDHQIVIFLYRNLFSIGKFFKEKLIYWIRNDGKLFRLPKNILLQTYYI